MSVDSRSSWKKHLFLATVVVAVLAMAWHVYLNVSLTHYGLSLRINTDENYLYIDSVTGDSPARAAGLREGDRILSFNGQELSTFDVDQLRETAIHAVRAPSIEFVVERNGVEESVYLEPELEGLNLYSALVLVVALVYIIMGIWVFFARRNYPAANAWGFFSVLMSGFVLSLGDVGTDSETLGLLFSIVLVCELFFGAAAGLHFALVFPRPTRLAKKRWLVPTLYVIPAFLIFMIVLAVVSTFIFTGLEQYGNVLGGIINMSINALFILYLTLMVLVLFFTYISNSDPSERRRIRLLILGTALPISTILLLIFAGNIFEIDNTTAQVILLLALAVMPFTYLYAIVRYRAMQIQVILKRGLVYSLLTGTLVILAGVIFISIFGLMLLFQDMLPGMLGREGGTFYQLASDNNVQKLMIAILSVFIGATVGSLKKKVQTFVDKRFYRERYSYKQAVESLAAVISQTHDIDHMMSMVIKSADDIVHPQTATFVLFEKGTGRVGHSLTADLEDVKLKQESVSALKRTFEGGRKYLSLRELNEELFEDGELLHAAMKRLKADMLLPIRNRKLVMGVIGLGKKLSETSYNSEELNMLYLLADQAALSLEHIKLSVEANEKEKLKRELAIGRMMQERMLPTAMPLRPGMEISALNMPAREVSGDFYTWVEKDENKLGVIVGDIVGKGVAGALNMAAIISTLMLIAEESNAVSEAMTRLNRYLVRHWPKRSFAAITYAMIDRSSNTFTWCNGGIPDPIFIPAGEEARYLETSHYPLPPGASAHSKYGEHSINYAPGDTLIILTDGAVEVKNQDTGEMIGYDGLLAFLNGVAGNSPQDIVEALASYIHSYQGSSVLDDDLTAVAIRFTEED